MYLPKIDLKTGNLNSLTLTPMEIFQLGLKFAKMDDVKWLTDLINRESIGIKVEIQEVEDHQVLQTIDL